MRARVRLCVQSGILLTTTNTTHRVHGDGGDFVVVCGIVLDEQVRADVPHLQGLVGTSRGQALTLRVKSYRRHHTIWTSNQTSTCEEMYNIHVQGKGGGQCTYSEWSWKVCRAWCVGTSHSFTSLSSEPVATSEASLLKHAVRTQLLCPTREHVNLREGKPQIYNAVGTLHDTSVIGLITRAS